jgi:hypothetical protein
MEQENQAPDFSEARSLHGARGTSAPRRTSTIHFAFLEGWRYLGAVLEQDEPLTHPMQAAVLIRPEVCYGAHYGLNSDIALGPKSAIAEVARFIR